MIGDGNKTERDCSGSDSAWATGGNDKIGEIRQGPMCIDSRPDVENSRVQVYDYIHRFRQDLGQCQISSITKLCEVQDYIINGG